MKYKVGDIVMGTVSSYRFYKKPKKIIRLNGEGYILEGCGSTWFDHEIALVTPAITKIEVEYNAGDVAYYKGTKYTVMKPYIKYHLRDEYGNDKYAFSDYMEKNEPVKEVTMADLELKYGCKVKVVK